MTAISVRRHPRVDAGFMVKLLSGSRQVLAKAVNLSMAGMSLVDPGEAGTPSELDGVQRVSISLPGEAHEVVMSVRVARRAGEEVALQFTHLDWDDLFVLARFMSPRL